MRKTIAIIGLLSCIIISSFAVERFPRPEFQSGYAFPEIQKPAARTTIQEYIDVGVLVLALSAASYLVVKKKSRKWLFPMAVASILYFGFYRKGCVCSVGSVQNIAYALFGSDYAIPLAVILFFAIPIVFTLLFGRTFCSHVCPFGCAQDVVHLKTVRVPEWLSHALGIIPYVYLGLSVMLAATGSAFLVCRFDPFVNIFRLSGDITMIVFGVIVLLLSVFVARPYCRFLCPYGVLLRWASYFSWKGVEPAAGECTNCGSCAKCCRYQAVRAPGDERTEEEPRARKRQLILLLVASPLIIGAGGFAGRVMSVPLSRLNSQVALADRLVSGTQSNPLSLEEEAFKTAGTSEEELYAEVKSIKDSFDAWGIALGAFVGIVFAATLVSSALRKDPKRYIPDRLLCISCGRCIEACPKERRKRE